MVRLEPLYFIGPDTEAQGGSVYPHDPGENLELPMLADGQDCQPWGVTQILRYKLWRIGRLGLGEVTAVTSVACIYARGGRGRT